MIARTVARAILKLGRWSTAGDIPAVDRYVLIAAPHTSNWDFIWTMSIAVALGVRVSWLGKHTLFRAPFGIVFRWFGGIGVVRDRRHNLVDELSRKFDAGPLVLLIPAEGTRAYTDYWRSGFYHVAVGAGVPLVLGYLDYRTRVGGFGPTLQLSGDAAVDMDTIRTFYAAKQGKFPALVGPVRLKDEDQVSTR